MKLAVIGATRGIGRCLVELALEEGHEVTALVRNPDRLDTTARQLSVVQGDILDAAAVKKSLEGNDAVCTAIGIGPTRKPVTVFSEGIRIVVAAMQATGMRQLACITGIGAGDSKNHGGFFYDRIINPLLLKTIYADKDREESVVKASDVEWVIIRPGFLTNGPLTGQYRVLTDLAGMTAGKISRKDVAHFVLTELAEKKYVGQTPLLTY
jgi:putative NADH-flavin reductase